MSQAQGMTKNEIAAAIAEKAFKDEGFRQRILADADAVFEAEIGQKLPAGMHIRVYEDDAHTVNFAIPARPANAGELSDAELEQVAGGTSPLTIVALFSISISASAALTGGMHKGAW